MHEGFIAAIAEAGITEGCVPERFCPLEAVTRAQMASFLQRALDLPHSDDDAFVDDQGTVHEDAIDALAAAGIAEGCGDGRFCPDDTVTRAQMAAFLVVGFDLIPSFVNFFRDGNGSVHEDAINACRVGSDVYINDERWRQGSQSFEDRELPAYQAYVVNHEVGHWVGLDHRECPFSGASAPVMLQQTISLNGCESRVWPLPQEHDAARRSLGLR